MTADDVIAWAKRARPGDRLTYHRGGKLALGDKPLFSEAVHAARHLYNLGLVELAQRRAHRPPRGKFQWFAEKKGRPCSPRPAFHNGGLAKHLFTIPDHIAAKAV